MNNPTGTETLLSTNGCDSIVTVDLTFISEITMSITDDLCSDESIEVNGVTYDNTNTNGIETLASTTGCDSIVTIDLNFFPENPLVQQTIPFCDSVFVIDDWIFQAGTVIDSLIDINGCDSIISTIVELDNCIRSISIVPTDLTCFGADDGTIFIEVLGDYNYPLEYSITFNFSITSLSTFDQEGDVLIEAPTAGIYDILITDNTGSIVFSESVTILSPPEIVVSLIEEARIDCNADMTGEISNQVIGGVMGPFNYIWSDQSTQSILSNVGAGIYSLTVEDSNNCTAENSITITEPDALSFDEDRTNITCNSNDGGSITISNIAGGVAPYMTSIDGVRFEDILLYENLEADSYEVTIQDMNGCTLTETVDIIIESSSTISPIDTIRIEEGQFVQIDLNLNFIFQSIRWSPSDGLSCDDCESPTASPLSDISYIVSVIDELGCEIITEVFVRVTEPVVIMEPFDVYIPNTFSKTINDGVNNFFKPLTSNEVDFLVESFIIYDRWGNIVHEESGIIEGWDGFIEAEEAVSGVYIYQLKYFNLDGNAEIRAGSITLVN